MDIFFKGMNETSECPFNEQDIQRCPFLRNISKPTSFSFSCLNIPIPVRGANGPIFEDGPNFDTAFKLFHGKDGVVPLSERPFFDDKSLETKPAPQFNPLAAKAASISLSGFGSEEPFGFDFFSKNWNNQKKKSESSKRESNLLRSSKVCELGLLNYKAKHVFYPFERKKFRCRYDYYWASVFKVEYNDHLGQTQLALAEAPNEALPLDCRPNFGVAWLTKNKFKVNETYDCWYTFGLSKVYIYHDNFFNCQAKDPSAIEMLRRYFILSLRILESWYTNRGRAWYWKWEAMAGLITGFSTSLISITMFRILQQVKSCLPQICKRACLFIAYFSVVGWLSIQYGKKLGLPDIFRVI